MVYKPPANLRLTPDLAYLIGVIQGDGTVHKSFNKKGWLMGFSIGISVGLKDKSYVYVLKNLIILQLKYNPYIRKESSHYNIRIYNRSLVRALENFKHNMKIPDFVLKNNKLLVAYLQGLFDTDGYCGIKGNSGVIDFSSNRKEFIESIKDILKSSFGIYSYIKIGKKLHYKPVYRLYITNKSNILKYIHFIGFRHPRKRKLSVNLTKIYENVRERQIRNKGHEKIIYVLQKYGEQPINDIVTKLNLHRETVREHLEKMEKGKIVKKRVVYFNRWGVIKYSHYKRHYWRLNDAHIF